MPGAPRATLDNPYGPQVTFRTEDVLPPSAYYLSQDDQVRLVYLTNQAPFNILVVLRLLTPQGLIQVMPYTIAANANLTLAAPVIELGMEGYLLGAYIQARGAGEGQCYIIVDLVKGSASSLIEAGQTLMQGYCTQLATLNYPPSTIEAFFSGPGTVGTITQNPPPGSMFDFTVPTATRWLVRSLCAQFATGGTAGSRVPTVQVVDDSGNTVAQIPTAAGIPASSSTILTWAPSVAYGTVAQYMTAPLPDPLILPAGYRVIGTFTSGGAGDGWTGVTLNKEEWVGM